MGINREFGFIIVNAGKGGGIVSAMVPYCLREGNRLPGRFRIVEIEADTTILTFEASATSPGTRIALKDRIFFEVPPPAGPSSRN